MKSSISAVHPYICTKYGREVRMAAETVPDGWDSYENQGYRLARECTIQAVGECDRPHYWELDTDHEVGSDALMSKTSRELTAARRNSKMTPNTDDEWIEQKIRDRILIKKMECKNCGTQPVAGWKNSQIQFTCECGGRVLPEDTVLNHEWMPDDVEWTVIDEWLLEVPRLWLPTDSWTEG